MIVELVWLLWRVVVVEEGPADWFYSGRQGERSAIFGVLNSGSSFAALGGLMRCCELRKWVSRFFFSAIEFGAWEPIVKFVAVEEET